MVGKRATGEGGGEGGLSGTAPTGTDEGEHTTGAEGRRCIGKTSDLGAQERFSNGRISPRETGNRPAANASSLNCHPSPPSFPPFPSPPRNYIKRNGISRSSRRPCAYRISSLGQRCTLMAAKSLAADEGLQQRGYWRSANCLRSACNGNSLV